MSRHFKARDNISQKMTKDGLVERNAVTGEDTRVSNRQTDIDLKNSKPEQNRTQSSGNSRADTSSNRKLSYSDTKTPDTPASNLQADDKSFATLLNNEAISVTDNTGDKQPQHSTVSSTPSTENPLSVKPSSNYRVKQTLKKQAVYQHTTKAQGKSYDVDAKQDKTYQAEKNSRLNFTKEETPVGKPSIAERKLNNAEHSYKRSADKLSKAREKLPTKNKAIKNSKASKKGSSTGKKLKFDKTPVSQKEFTKGTVMTRPVKGATNLAFSAAHRKIYQHEEDNVGLKASHRIATTAESGVRSVLRFHKTVPYRKVEKLERITARKHIKVRHRRNAVQNARKKQTLLSKALQKRKIKRNYAKAVREAQKAARKAKAAGGFVSKLGRVVLVMVKRHPILTIIIILLALLVFLIMTMFSACTSIGGGSVTGVIASSYIAADEDMLGAEAVYAEMEDDLQYQLDNYEELNPGYDEYHYQLDSIWHDPYVLISILSSLHDGEWALGEVQVTLVMLFDLQYILTETLVIEERTRIETRTVIDPETEEEYEEEYQVKYNYYIMTVTLENYDLSHLPIYIMSTDRLSRYATLMSTLGNRPDLFPVGQFPHASYYQDYGQHTIPPEYLNDETFAAIITEAEKYLGFPYIWGGSTPETSFDCSGYVSWVLNQTGWSFGRLGAKGLYNICTPVTPEQARPGDLVFFNYTYNAPEPHLPTHVGIYVGDGMMIHAGKPIGYASINTTYYKEHFYGFGRP